MNFICAAKLLRERVRKSVQWRETMLSKLAIFPYYSLLLYVLIIWWIEYNLTSVEIINTPYL